jgi:hypothetical protein
MCIDDSCLSSLRFTLQFTSLCFMCMFLYDDVVYVFFCILFSVPDQPQYQFAPFSDPAIMSARFASPVLSSGSPSYASTPAPVAAVPTATAPYGPPPGLAYPNSESLSVVQGRESQVRVPSSACSAQILPPAIRDPGPSHSTVYSSQGYFGFPRPSPPFVLPSTLV